VTARRRVVVLGDLLLDRDVLGRVERVCPDAPVPVVDVEEVRSSPGGAGLTALLCASSVVDVTLVAPVADDDDGRTLREQLGRGGVPVVPLPHHGPTRRKTRVRSAGQSLLRLDDGGPGRPSGPVPEAARQAVEAADVVLVSDYGAGTTTDPAVRELLTAAARTTVLCWDPHPRGGSPVPGCTLVTPNLAEARAAAGSRSRPDVLATVLRPRWRARGVAVTAGTEGAWLATSAGEPLYVPASHVTGDPCGAGDRFAATAALTLARGGLLADAVADAVAAASAWVAAGGASAHRPSLHVRGLGVPPSEGAPPATHRTHATTPSLRDHAIPPTGSGGLLPQREVPPDHGVVGRVRAAGGTVVATGGCFDVLHAGHVACLEAARRLGDVLVVLLNSDASVRRLKGPGRPLVPAEDRAQVLRGLASVDEVVVFDEDDPCAALARLRPDVWAKGGDYGGTPMPEADLVRSWGGRVVLLPYLAGRSTTAILEEVR
jgi:rfaE bifunctional protein nucleotidyltransferase chain/domain/rfaE bifunctional protein kinase chain/domain